MTRSSVRPTPPARLRRGCARDLDALVAFEAEFFGPDHRISRRSFRRFLASPKSTLIVAEIGGKVAGCVLVNYRRGSTRARLYTIAVAAALQRRGIARQLLAAAERSAAERGRRIIRLEVREDNAAAIALYESSGYGCFGRYRCYYGDRTDALRLEKPLAPKPPRQRADFVWTDCGAGTGFDGGQRPRRSRQRLHLRL